MNRRLRARVLLEEARALGLDVDDLVAAATGDAKPITVAAWIDEIAPTFTPATTATYRPYWRLTARLLGDRYLASSPPPTSWPWSTSPPNVPDCTAPIRPAGPPERPASPLSAPSTPGPSTPDT